MRTMQVFYYSDMPGTVRQSLFDDKDGYGNDCFVKVDLTDYRAYLNASESEKEDIRVDFWGGELPPEYLVWLEQHSSQDTVLVEHSW